MQSVDLNPVYELVGGSGLTMRLSTICHDMGMRAYFEWQILGQERADEEYAKAYAETLRRFAPNHPHLKTLEA